MSSCSAGAARSRCGSLFPEARHREGQRGASARGHGLRGEGDQRPQTPRAQETGPSWARRLTRLLSLRAEHRLLHGSQIPEGLLIGARQSDRAFRGQETALGTLLHTSNSSPSSPATWRGPTAFGSPLAQGSSQAPIADPSTSYPTAMESGGPAEHTAQRMAAYVGSTFYFSLIFNVRGKGLAGRSQGLSSVYKVTHTWAYRAVSQSRGFLSLVMGLMQ